MQAIAGFFGTTVGALVTIFGFIVAVTIFVLLWKAGALPVIGEALLIILRGLFITLPVEGFRFLRDLLAFATS